MMRAMILIALLALAGCDGEQDAHDHAAAQPAPAAEGHADEHADDHGEGHDDHADAPAQTTIAAAIADESGIRTAPAAAGTIADMHEVQGLLTPIDGRQARVTARFPGPVRQLTVNVGDRVSKGQLLAVIESNLSLSNYRILAPIDGVVMARNAEVGDVAGEGALLLELADLSALWVDLHIFGSDADHIPVGARVALTRLSDGAQADTVIERILPGTATASQSTVARARVANADGRWRPGSAVRAQVTVAQKAAALTVPLSALQELDGAQVVFVREGETYAARPLRLGQRDARNVEVLSGLRAGEQVVVAQSYLIKADIEKAGAAHEH